MRQILFFTFLLLTSIRANSQSEYEYQLYHSPETNIDLQYRLLRPENPATGRKYPLVIFLHGAGERGTDNESPLIHGSGMFTNPVNRERYPAYVLFPQCPPDEYWAFVSRPEKMDGDLFPVAGEITPILQTVKELIDSYLLLPDIDKERIYLIGLSMGGMATFDLTCRFPELFAAAIPICGAVNTERLSQAKGVNFRIFHGDKDSVVPVENSRRAYLKLKAEGYPVEYIEFPGYDHDSWTPAFNYPGFMEWLFSNQK